MSDPKDREDIEAAAEVIDDAVETAGDADAQKQVEQAISKLSADPDAPDAIFIVMPASQTKIAMAKGQVTLMMSPQLAANVVSGLSDIFLKRAMEELQAAELKDAGRLN